MFVDKQTVFGQTILVNAAFVPSGASLSSSSSSSVCECESMCVCVSECVCVCACVQTRVKLLSLGRKSVLPMRAHFGLY